MVFNATFNNISVILWQSSPKYMSIINIIDGIKIFLNCNYNYLIQKKYNQKVFVKYDSQFLKHLKRNFQNEQGEVIILAY